MRTFLLSAYTYNQLFYSSLLLSIFINSVCAQSDKFEIEAMRINIPIVIDGKVNEKAWLEYQSSPRTYLQMDPDNGEPSRYQTETKVLYDDFAIYVAFICYDPSPDSILKELGRRDIGENNADIVGIFLDPFHDTQNALGFFVSASGVQTDVKFSNIGDDFNWNAVWYSAHQITESGWQVEIKIPFSQLRFPKQSEQVWGINFLRIVRRYREKSSFFFVDKLVPGFVNQFGDLINIRDIRSPTRLSFMPYFSSYLEHYPFNVNGKSDYSTSFNGGMDLKYGINESFTLDLTLVPDFGQVQSDNIILNLSPFEIRYDEMRAFFTEGTELFNKAGLFYSRRIGKTPDNYSIAEQQLKTGEVLIENPTQSQLLNATKISGRTNKGMGLGIFNAFAAETEATIEDSFGQQRNFLTQPFTNYNIMVFDRPIRTNSFLSFINTNVAQVGGTKNANVAASEFKFSNKSNSYAFWGITALSNIRAKTTQSKITTHGLRYEYYLGKTNGNFQYNFGHEGIAPNYDQNDLGFQLLRNYKQYSTTLAYNIYKPFGQFNYSNNSMTWSYRTLYENTDFNDLLIFGRHTTTTRKFLSIGLFYTVSPIGNHDYYETRRLDRYLDVPSSIELGAWISSDYRKNIALDVVGSSKMYASGRNELKIDISPRIRLSDKFLIIYKWNQAYKANDVGFVFNDLGGNIMMGVRNITEISNELRPRYIFSNKLNLQTRFRHYWSKAEYSSIHSMNEVGVLESGREVQNEYDVNFNIFNIDMSLVWVFQPGSELSVVWKNLIQSQSELEDVYIANFRNTLDQEQLNSLSAKFIYYLDYQYFKKQKLY